MRLVGAVIATLLCGCGTVQGTPDGATTDGGADAASACAGHADGFDCGGGRVCASGVCRVLHTCAEWHAVVPAAPDGKYSIDPDGDGAGAPFDAWCDMTRDGGGWMRLEGAQYPFLFTPGDWEATGLPFSPNFSDLGHRKLFAPSGTYTLRLDVGTSGSWTDPPTHSTIWTQGHDPFTATSDGSDYVYVSGDVPTSCGGFDGLHAKYQGYSVATEVDQNDSSGCWEMQIVPTVIYSGASGYLDGYLTPALSTHVWQTLWVR